MQKRLFSTNFEFYKKILNENNVKLVIAIGPAGTGKTMGACQEAIKQLKEGNIKKIVPIFSGIIDFYERNDIVYNTLDPNAANYINMGNSINQVSGGEYSYNFWLYVDNTNKQLFGTTNDGTNTTQIFADQGLTASSNPNLLPFVLFLRGSNKVLEYYSSISKAH